MTKHKNEQNYQHINKIQCPNRLQIHSCDSTNEHLDTNEAEWDLN